MLGSHELFHREQTPPARKPRRRRLPRRRIESRAIDSFLELNEGDLVVHVVHGIARFRGMQMLDRTHQDRRQSPARTQATRKPTPELGQRHKKST